MKDIVVIANFCSRSFENSNNRFIYLCKELAKNNKIELITSNFSHSSKEHRVASVVDVPFKITLLEEPGYQKNVSLRRILSHYQWGKAVQKYLQQRKKPDVVYCAVPSLTAPLAAAKYCNLNGIKYMIDIQDLWPEAFEMVLNIPILNKVLFFPIRYQANKIYACADEIIAVSEQYVQRALSVNKKNAVGHAVYIGTSLERYDDGAKGTPALVKPNGEIWIGYCGSLAISYDIPNLLNAVEILIQKGITGLKLIIMGDGGYRQYFEAIAMEKEINAIFTGKLPYEQMCAQLNECDIVVNPIKRGSAASIINKHGDYAASGRPVVNSQDNIEYRELIARYSMGLNCNNEDAVDMADKLERLITNAPERIEMGKNARLCAAEKFDRISTYQTILRIINE